MEVTDLRALAQSLGVKIELSEDTSVLAQPVKVGPFTAPNSLAVHPMEGCDADAQGRPEELTLRRYERFAGGGAGLLWAEAIAVVPEGRANPRQLWINPESRPAFTAMVEMMRSVAARNFGEGHRPIIVAQLTHSGRYSRPIAKPHPLIPQRDPYRDARIKLPKDWPVLADDYLDQLQEKYVEAAALAFDAGFDAVDIKACHGYLINELFACHQRPGKYGGSFENRTRFLLEVIDRIHNRLGQDKMVVTRMGCFDGIPHPYGWAVDKGDASRPDLTEPKKLVEQLVRRGVPMVNVTIANPYYNPHYNRPFNEPVAGQSPSPEHPLVGVERITRVHGEMQKSFPQVAIVGTGYSWLRTWMPFVAAAAKKNGLATFIGGGRLAFAYPDFARDIVQGRGLDPNKVCVACSGCTQIMRDGGRAGCVVRDNAIYGPIFRHGRMSNRDNLARLAASCRQCRDSTCRMGCPAGMNIPQFIKLFLDGDDRAAYEVMRESNIFPEVCAWLCPVEQQCQGHCLAKVIGDGPLPIADIQRYLAEQANRNGWSRLRIPEKPLGRRVAIIGAGPAGLACAAKLIEAGVHVTLFDKSSDRGGMIASVIPADRQSSALGNEIAAIFKDLPEERASFLFGRAIGENFTLDDVLRQGFDAVFIGMGLSQSSGEAGSRRLKGLWSALKFLSAAKKAPSMDLSGQTVAVIGGGNTAMDAASAARKLGAKDVYLIYRRSFEQMPAWPAERDRALNAGVHFLILTQQLDYLEKEGRIAGIKLCPTRLGAPDASGRRAPEAQPLDCYTLDLDDVVEAIGQQAPVELAQALPDVELAKGLIKLRKGSYRTSRERVFAGGDLVHGASTVVAAVADGMRAAAEITEMLKGNRHD